MTDLANFDPIERAGQIANRIAGQNAFQDYRSRRSAYTLRRQDNDLALFARFLQSTGLPYPDNFGREASSWRGITWGLVSGFVRWLLADGYAVATVNVRLSTVKVYAGLAAKAEILDKQELLMIESIKGYKGPDAVHVDDQRKESGIPTRRCQRWTGERANKKATPVSLSEEQAEALKAQPLDTPQGRRDALLMCLMLDHGLRAGEIARLTVDNFELKTGRLRFYRPKVHRTQNHKLTKVTLEAAKAYLTRDAPALGNVWRRSLKNGELANSGLTARAISERVHDLGEAMGIFGLSAHDCRHYWATLAAFNKTPIERLKDAGGWSSLTMVAQYIEAAKDANEGVIL